MKNAKILSALFILLSLLCFALPFGSAANEPTEKSDIELLQDALTYQGMSMRLGGDTSGIRSLWHIDNAVVNALEAKNYTVSYGAIMGIAKKNDGTEIRSDAQDLEVERNLNLGFKLKDGVANAATCVVYESGLPKYASNTYLSYGASDGIFAYTTLFGEGYETEDFYNLKMVYRGFVALTKDGNTQIAYVDQTTDQLEATVSLTDLAIHYYHTYTGAYKATYQANRLLLRVLSFAETEVNVDTAAEKTTASLLSDGATYKLTADTKLTLNVSNVRATGFYKVTAKLNNNNLYLPKIEIVRGSANGADAYTSGWRIGEKPDSLTADGDDSAYLTDGAERVVIGYQYLAAGSDVNTLTVTTADSGVATGTVGLSDIQVELIDLPISGKDSILLSGKNDRYGAGDVGNVADSGQGVRINDVDSSISFTVEPLETGIYSAAMLAHIQKATVSMTVTDHNGKSQVLSNSEAKNALLPSDSSSIAAYYTLTGEFELCLKAGETYTVTLSLANIANVSGSHMMYLEYLLLQKVGSYDGNDNTIRVNLWESDVTGGTLLSDKRTYFATNGTTLKFTVNAKTEGMYAVRMLETHYTGNKLTFLMSTDENTYTYSNGEKKFYYPSRPEVGTGNTAPTVTDQNEYIVDQSMLKAELTDAMVYGYIYLMEGKNTVSVKMNGAGTTIGIAAMELENVAPFNAETDVRIKAYEGATTANTVTFSATYGWYEIGTSTYVTENVPSVSYEFTIDEAGWYDIYAYGRATGKSGQKTSTYALTFAGKTNTSFSQKVSYTHTSNSAPDYMSIGNTGSAGMSIAFDESVYFDAGTYTVTCTPEENQRSVTLSDIRISKPQPVYVPEKEATCVDGNIAYWYQASKDKCFSDAEGQNEINKLLTVRRATRNHDYVQTHISDSDCTTRGYEILTCSLCGATEQHALDPHGHTFTAEWTVTTPATCTTEGSESCVCDVCRETVTKTIPATHAFGEWKKNVDPTLSAGGSLIRTCSVAGCGETELYTLPALDARNSCYKLYKTDGVETVTYPTFESAGAAFFYTRIDNQSFFFKAEIPVLSEYYANRADLVLYEIENATGGTYNAETDTLHLTKNTEMSISVNAPKAGFYNLYIKYSNKANTDTCIKVFNDSDTAWTAFAYSYIPASFKSTAMQYDLYAFEQIADFPTTECTTLYLVPGENNLRISFTKEIGVSDMLFAPELLNDGSATTVLHPYGEGEGSSNNGWKFNPGKNFDDISVVIPEDGTYKLYAMMSTTGGYLNISSKDNKFAAQKVAVPQAWGNSTEPDTDAIHGTYLREITTLPLTQGTHNLRMTMDQMESKVTLYMHFNYLAFVKVGDLESSDPLTVTVGRTVNENEDSVTLSVKLSGMDASASSEAMLVKLEGYYLMNDGSEIPFSKSVSKTAYTETVSFTTDPLTDGKDGVSYRVNVYSADGARLLYSDPLHHYSNSDTLTVYAVADMHYTGSNTSQLIYKYHNDTWGETVLKTYNSNSTACDIYGMTTDEKLQRIMDDIIQRYAAGEFDILVFTGDQSMNDGNYMNFAEDHIMHQTGSQYGQNIDEFWASPLNLDLILQEQYFSQLADHGIPFICENGNHDYLMKYNEGHTEISYEPWEEKYHYRELFGHKNADGIIYDATPVDFLVRVIRRDGEVKVVSALSSAELEKFKLAHKDDWNNYDYYVSEDTLCETDVELGNLLMTAPYQIDTFEYYHKQYVYIASYDGSVSTSNAKDFEGQTYRSEYHTMDVLNAMSPMVDAADSVWFFGHNYRRDLDAYIVEHENIRGMFYGDLHEQRIDNHVGLIPKWCIGACVGTFDVSTFLKRDPATGEFLTDNATKHDNQYWNKNSGKVGSTIAGNFVDNPYSGFKLHIRGTESYIEREHISFFYQNTQPSYNIMFNKVVGWDPMYKRAVDYTKEAGTSFKVGNRTVYVGGDTYIVGDGTTTYINIARSYTVLEYNKPEYVLAPQSGMTYTVCDTAGRPLNANGKPVITDGGDAVTVTLSSTDEGTTLSLYGETYYTVSKAGGIVGHYLYDENGDFVYEDQNGNLVFYDFYKDENGDFMLEYFYEDENGGFVPLGYWNDTHTEYKLYNGVFTHEGGSYTDENGDEKTSAGIWISGDVLTISKLDATHNDREQLTQVVNVHNNCQYKVTSANITIENGVLVCGEGFVHRSYTYRFVDAYGNEVEKDSVSRTQLNTWTYTANGFSVGDTFTKTNNTQYQEMLGKFSIVDNGLQDVYGMYMPREVYGKTWMTK